MQLFLIISVCALAAGIRIPVWPITNQEAAIKLSIPYGQIAKEYLGSSSVKSVSPISNPGHNENINKRNALRKSRFNDPKSKFAPLFTENEFDFTPQSKWLSSNAQIKYKLERPKTIQPIVYTFHTSHEYPFNEKYNLEDKHQSKPYSDSRLKNYRDDILEESNNEKETPNKKQTSSKNQESNHEITKDVATRPIYPGEGLWAIKGLKHRPYVSSQKYTKLEESNEHPEGYDTFEDGLKNFRHHQNNFNQNFKSVPQIKQVETVKDIDEGSEENESYEEDKENEEESDFVPVKLYAQVRKTENEEHLPNSVNEPRLREVIKDSKIQIVYSEEGYEDSAYDHEGHEKNAENSEGYVEKSKDKGASQKQRELHNAKLKKLSKEIAEDTSEIADKYFKDDHETADSNQSKIKIYPRNKYLKNKKETESNRKIIKSHIIDTEANKKVPKILNRQKRFTNDFPQLIVDTEFLDDIKTNTKEKVIATTAKYPYYKIAKGVHKISPLRYAENLKNIPKKEGGRMAFYEQADHMKCDEVESDVQPIPERIKNAETSDSSEDVETPKSPRLGSLGDKIDCFKIKYFGENPLDSPIFNEDVIEKPVPVFEEIEKIDEIRYKNQANLAQHVIKSNSISENFKSPSIKNENIKKSQDWNNKGSKRVHDNTYASSEESKIENKSEENLPKLKMEKNIFLIDLSEDNFNLNINDDKVENQKENDEKSIESQKGKNEFSSGKEIEGELKEKLENDEDYIEYDEKYEDENENIMDSEEKWNASFLEKLKSHFENAESLDGNNENYKDQRNFKYKLIDKGNKKCANCDEKKFDDYETNEENLEINSTSSQIPKEDHQKEAELKSYPKNIYDQIDMFNEEPESTTSIPANMIKIYDFEKKEKQKLENSFNNTNNRTPKVSDSVFLVANKTISKEKQNVTSIPIENLENIEKLPESLPYRMIRRKYRPQTRVPNPLIFDISRFIPTAIPIYNHYSTATPKYKTISEVYYKDEIKPIEQLNVFADVINNIKNSSRDAQTAASEAEPISVRLNTQTQKAYTHRKNTVKRKSRPRSTTEVYLSEIETDEMLENFYQTSTTPPRRIKKKKKTNIQLFNDFVAKLNEERQNKSNLIQIGNFFKNIPKEEEHLTKLYKTKRLPTTTTEKIETDIIFEDQLDTSDDVLGLVPPIIEDNLAMKQNKLQISEAVGNEVPLNKFYVRGMQPPPRIKPITYAEYKQLSLNKLKRATYPLRRFRRSNSQRAYSDIRRNNEPIEDTAKVEEDLDDYEPHRHRKFHYDENSGKIIYDKTTEEPEIEYEEVEEEIEDYGGLIPLKEPLPISKKRTTTEGPPTTPGIDFSLHQRKDFNYLEFVTKLKANDQYHEIPDPTTTEKGASTTTTATITEKTSPPEFLDILAKLKSNSEYKEIKDKDSKKTFTTSEPEEEIKAIEAETLEGIQNSPGGDLNYQPQNSDLQIFDISEYLPKVKNYSPRTSIDTSKYKSIDRTPLRHTISSKYSEEETSPADSEFTLRKEESTDSVRHLNKETGINSEDSLLKKYVENKSEVHAAESRFEQDESTITPTTSASTTTTTTTTATIIPTSTTSKRRVASRGRKRFPTTLRSKTTTKTEEIFLNPTEEPTVTQKKHARVFPRRQRVRIRTTEIPNVVNENVNKERIQRRVHLENDAPQQQIIPSNHKKTYTPLVIPENSAEMYNKETQILSPRIITPEIVAANKTNTSMNGKPKKKEEVEIFSKYDQTKKHGGNYRREEEKKESNNIFIPPGAYELETSEKLARLVDAVPKPFAFYSDSKLPTKINLLKEDQPKEGKDTKIEDAVAEEDYTYDDEVTIKFEPFKEASTKKPLFIKDPSKRLYFYAPIKK